MARKIADLLATLPSSSASMEERAGWFQRKGDLYNEIADDVNDGEVWDDERDRTHGFAETAFDRARELREGGGR